MKSFLLIILLCAECCAAIAQGCSDAGFCTMGAMKPDQPYNKKLSLKLRSLEFSQYYGKTHFNNKIYVQTIEANLSVGQRYVMQVKVPYLTAHGHLGTFSGLSDISLSLTRNIISNDAYDLNVTLGTKIPTNKSNKEIDGLGLPMYYQTSLGSYDLILGASIINRKWLFAIGYQQALTRNENGFWRGEWAGRADNDYIQRYEPSINLKRGKDLMLRAERNFRLSRFNASVGLLPIWRFTKDIAENPTTHIDEKKIGSDGIALSSIYTLGYNFNVRSGLKLLGGNRLIRRRINPDGLSRDYVLSLTYTHRF